MIDSLLDLFTINFLSYLPGSIGMGNICEGISLHPI